jgi:hypothetical protein
VIISNFKVWNYHFFCKFAHLYLDGADAKRYQEKDVSMAIQEVERAKILEEENELNEDEV